MRREERVAWACFVLMAAILGWSAGRAVPRAEPTQKLPLPVEVHLRLDEVEARIKGLAGQRCWNVTTDRLDVGIFPTGNLGKAKVEAP